MMDVFSFWTFIFSDFLNVGVRKVPNCGLKISDTIEPLGKTAFECLFSRDFISVAM